MNTHQFPGLTQAEAESNRVKFGSNELTQIPPEGLAKKLLKGFRDPLIVILLVALAIQLILLFCGQAEWFEPLGVLVAILIANGVAAVSECRQEAKSDALKKEQGGKEKTKVYRDGLLREIAVNDVVTGDIVFLQPGDKIPADGIIVSGSLRVDQSSLNGETEECPKSSDDCGEFNEKDLLNSRFVYRGTVVCQDEALMEVRKVGDATMFGQLSKEVQEERRATPLQLRLGKLAGQISLFGYIGAAAIILAVIGKNIFSDAAPSDFMGWLRLFLDAFTVAVTVIVCAVPEGLPMLTSILMSYKSMRMVKDNVLVRKINGLETAGCISILFSDKTGTITEGRLSVAELARGDAKPFTSLKNAPSALKKSLLLALGLNNGANLGKDGVVGGNSTDRALLEFLKDELTKSGLSREIIASSEPFDSFKKMSGITVIENGKETQYLKGAPEKILERCAFYMNADGTTKPFDGKDAINAYMKSQASRAMRTLAAAMKTDTDENAPLILLAVVSIRDNVRKEAAEAIREVRGAGVQVVMVTGDRSETACAIAKEAGLLHEEFETAVTSAELAAMSDEEVKQALPRIRVVSRALPSDKSRLVRLAQEMDHVVGMTGDGVNDSPALKKADVGFAMGSGTEVAKEAGDITILDDNFASICKAILYGRTMYKCIKKFLKFQLTVNIGAVLVCFIAPLFGWNVVLTVVQLLLVNLAMDTLAALAFASEPNRPEYMLEKPVARSAGLVDANMFAGILTGALYIAAACLAVLLLPSEGKFLGLEWNCDPIYLRTCVFAAFMMAIAFNGFNARTESINPLKGLGGNPGFLVVMGIIFAMQLALVSFGGEALKVMQLGISGWLVCGLLAFLVIPVDMIRKILFGSAKSQNKN